jgi:uncharacterized alkaline shock family protein YloU
VNGLPPVRFHVADAVVARVAELRARQVPGVVALRPGGTGAAVHGDSADVTVAVVTRLGHNCRDLAQAVQREVAAEVARFTGLATVVAVTIVEILLD